MSPQPETDRERVKGAVPVGEGPAPNGKEKTREANERLRREESELVTGGRPGKKRGAAETEAQEQLLSLKCSGLLQKYSGGGEQSRGKGTASGEEREQKQTTEAG